MLQQKRIFLKITTSVLAGIFCLGLSTSSAHASTQASAQCQANTVVGATCTATISELNPTQLTVGVIEVDARAKRMADMSDSELSQYEIDHTVPVVIGPSGIVYITDHHHYALALAKVKGDHTRIPAYVIANWTTLSTMDFWRHMAEAQYTYLYDEHGQGPLTIDALPSNLFDLKDDPYRSLAWGVRKNGGYKETTAPRADFAWAAFFRTRIPEALIESYFDTAVRRGSQKALSPDARNLPGYIGHQ
jgi:hypothetical protein